MGGGGWWDVKGGWLLKIGEDVIIRYNIFLNTMLFISILENISTFMFLPKIFS